MFPLNTVNFPDFVLLWEPNIHFYPRRLPTMGIALSRVCLYVCPRSKRTTAWAIDTKFCTLYSIL